MVKNKQKLTLPANYSEDLAEETGIHIGDGSLGFYHSVGKNNWCYMHSTHAQDDKEHSDYVKNLMKRLYNLDPYVKIKGKCIMLVYTRKELVLFKKDLGLPIGKKSNIKIPDWILENKEFTKKCVRGIVDSDGCFRFRKPFRSNIHSYPEIKVTNKSKILVHQLKDIFSDFGIKCSLNLERKKYQNGFSDIYVIHLNGIKNTGLYVSLFGSSNTKHLKKYYFWKKHGYYIKEKMAKVGFEFVDQ